MTELDLERLLARRDVARWRIALARWIEAPRVQHAVTAVIVLNAVVLGLETDAWWRVRHGWWLTALDRAFLFVFVVELGVKLAAYRLAFWRTGWNVFDAAVIGVALVPGAGPWAVLRSLRVLRVLRLLTVVPQLRRVVAAFLHAIPGLLGVIAVMATFYYTAGVLATTIFGPTHADWFGTLGRSLYTLFQVMTLESWSMGIVRPVMEQHPWAWAFFIPFIVIATFTILNLFVGIIVSTMQELSALPEPGAPQADVVQSLARIERDVRELRARLEEASRSMARPS